MTRLDLQPGPGLGAPTMWVVAMAHQLAVPVVPVMQSAAGIVAPMAPALPKAGLCQRQVRLRLLAATGAA